MEQAPRVRLAVYLHAPKATTALPENPTCASLDGLRHGPFHRQIFLAILVLQLPERTPTSRELLRLGGVGSYLAEQVLERPEPRGFLGGNSEQAVKLLVRRPDAARFVEHRHAFRHPANGLAQLRFHVLFPALARFGSSAFNTHSKEVRGRETQPAALDTRAVLQRRFQYSRSRIRRGIPGVGLEPAADVLPLAGAKKFDEAQLGLLPPHNRQDSVPREDFSRGLVHSCQKTAAIQQHHGTLARLQQRQPLQTLQAFEAVAAAGEAGQQDPPRRSFRSERNGHDPRDVARQRQRAGFRAGDLPGFDRLPPEHFERALLHAVAPGGITTEGANPQPLLRACARRSRNGEATPALADERKDSAHALRA